MISQVVGKVPFCFVFSLFLCCIGEYDIKVRKDCFKTKFYPLLLFHFAQLYRVGKSHNEATAVIAVSESQLVHTNAIFKYVLYDFPQFSLPYFWPKFPK